MSGHEQPIFDAVVRIDKLPASGRSISVEANETERAAIAEAMQILSVERFSATLSIAPLRGGLRALGHLDAEVTQASVVSFLLSKDADYITGQTISCSGGLVMI